MFTGIVKYVGKVSFVKHTKDLLRIRIASKGLPKFAVGSSIAINGVCLTVVKSTIGNFEMEIVQETIKKTSLGSLEIGAPVNIEPALTLQTPLDGHIVQGHIDTTATVKTIAKKGNNIIITFQLEKDSPYIIEKGSIAIDGVALTIAGIRGKSFSVAIIPHTWAKTTFRTISLGKRVNIEFDVLLKFLANLHKQK